VDIHWPRGLRCTGRFRHRSAARWPTRRALRVEA